MTREQAKEILACYRDDSDFPESESLTEALKLLEEDTQLQEWFEAEQKFDDALTDALNDIEVPNNLRRDILSQYSSKKDNTIQLNWWQIFNPIGAAAALFLMAGLLVMPWKQSYHSEAPPSLESLEDFAVYSLKQATGFDYSNSDGIQLVQHMQSVGMPAPTQMPGALGQLPTSGCMALEYEDRTVGLVCFEESSKSHLFVMNKEDFPELEDQEKPLIRGNSFASTAFWTRDGKHYLLFINDSPEKLAELVSY